MSTNLKSTRSWIGRKKVFLFVASLPIGFVLAPFPIGMGLIYPIRDHLRGHPQGRHGTQLPKFVGLWVRDNTIAHDFVGQSFYLMPDGRFAGMTGLTERRWHFDDKRLFIDAVSHCGNCYQGNVTAAFTTKFLDPDRLLVTNQNKDATKGIGGLYRRVKITDGLKSKLNQLQVSGDDASSFKAWQEFKVIEMFDLISKRG